MSNGRAIFARDGRRTAGALTRVLIAGAGGHASEVRRYLADVAHRDAIQCIGCVDDTLPAGQHPWRELHILGIIDEPQPAADAFIVAVGDNYDRRRIVERLMAVYDLRCRFMTLVHPAALVGDNVVIGEGTCVAPGAILTERIRIGRHCIVNVKASVSHDCEIGNFVSLNPGVTICGSVRIGDGALIGAGATVIQHITVGAGAIVGAGSVVISDVAEGVTVMGVPARPKGSPAT